MGSGGIAPQILNRHSRRRRVVCNPCRQLYLCGKNAGYRSLRSSGMLPDLGWWLVTEVMRSLSVPRSSKVGQKDSPKTSVTNHQTTPRRKTENSQHLVRREKWKYYPCCECNSDSVVDLPVAQSLYCPSYLGSWKRTVNLTLSIFAFFFFYFLVLFNLLKPTGYVMHQQV